MEQKQSQLNPWKSKFYDVVRALTGAFLFGIPLIYTVEMWWIAVHLDLWKLFLLLALGFGANLYLAHLVGLREGATLYETVNEALQNIAVGVIALAVTLFVLDRIAWADPLDRTLSGILLQSIPLSIGAAITHTTRQRDKRAEESEQQQGITWNYP